MDRQRPTTEPTAADPEQSVDVHATLASLAHEWARAIVSNDAERIGSYITDDWVIVSETGVSPRADFLALVASGDLTHSAMQAIAPIDVRLLGGGDTAVLIARVTNTAHYRGERFDADEWTTDVYVRRDDRWLCALSHITPARDPA